MAPFMWTVEVAEVVETGIMYQYLRTAQHFGGQQCQTVVSQQLSQHTSVRNSKKTDNQPEPQNTHGG
jgi:hypothetical protein